MSSVSYNRDQLLALRNSAASTDSNQIVVGLIPGDLLRDNNINNENVKPVITYSSEELRAIRDNLKAQNDDFDVEITATSSLPTSIPSDLLRPSRFRCDSNCLNEQQHETKQILKYTRMELLRYRAAATQSCAAQTRQAESQAPEIFLRSLGH